MGLDAFLTVVIFSRSVLSFSAIRKPKEGSKMTYLECAISDGHAKFSGEGKQQQITYLAGNKDTNNAL